MKTAPASHSSPERDRLWSARMVAAQGGDRSAYEALLRECVPHVKRLARRTGVRPESIDDVVQDVLITVHRARQTYDPALSFTAWLNAIAQRRAIDLLRRRGRYDKEVSDQALYEAYPDLGETPDEAYEGAERSRMVRDAVAGLPAGQREAVDALALRQLSLTEAAAETGKSTGALKVNLHRALKALRGRFGKAE